MSEEKLVREHDKFMLRLPDGMRERIADVAKAAGRSMNTEIVKRLGESLELDAAFTGAQAAERDFGDSPRQIFQSYKAERDVERRQLDMLIINQRMLLTLLKSSLSRTDPAAVAKLERFFPKLSESDASDEDDESSTPEVPPAS